MIDFRDDGALWRITLNRPKKANSLTAAMLEELICIVDKARQGPNVFVLTGAGSVFSAGADLDEARAGLAVSPLWEQLSRKIAALNCLTVTALNGTMAGGAFGMALACDLRVAVDGAKFVYPVMKLGFLPQPSDPARLSALVGPARAKMILLAGQKITAAQALDWGLIQQVCATDTLNNTLQDLVADALNAKSSDIAAIKSLMR